MATESLLLAVELKANSSLLAVGRVREVSEEATRAADRLRWSLQGVRETSSAARVYALEARTKGIAESQASTGVSENGCSVVCKTFV